MRTCDEIFDTIQSKLSEIWQDTRTHREIALDSEFTLAKVFPRPFYKAAEAVALHNGWHLESFMLSLLNNLPFIEHRATRLTPTAGKQLEHTRADSCRDFFGPAAKRWRHGKQWCKA